MNLAPASLATTAAPIGAAEFDASIARLGPFESRPHVAVAVSGGADSLALALLADGWARGRGGRIEALIVDHGLRPESGREATQVGTWLAGHGIAWRVLAWTGAKPRTGVQAGARAARRDLLTRWCRGTGILHLLLAHHSDDQAETLVLRLGRGSGRDGLAAMAAVVETADLRVLRPLLGIPHARLVATLEARGQHWIEDPSNQDPRFARVRVRQQMHALAACGAGAADLWPAARRLGLERQAREAALARFVAGAVDIFPEGWASIDPRAFRAAPAELSRPALIRVLLAVGGGAYPPRGARLDRLHGAIRGDGLAGGRTLAGCRLVPRENRILVVREPAAAAPRTAADGPQAAWDRFRVRLAPKPGDAPPGAGAWIARLGAAGWVEIVGREKGLRDRPVPAAARAALPALWDLDGVLEVPHLLYRRRGADPDSLKVDSARWRPSQALAGPGFLAF
ncbi:MAG: tRNA lysidine(34) synthetase TilS [Pseudomonadota bacterium]